MQVNTLKSEPPLLSDVGMPSRDLRSLRQHVEALQRQNAQLKSQLASLQDHDQNFYRSLFDTMDEGFCIIEFFDGPHGPLSDYVHVLANAAYAKHAGIPNVVGQKLREMVPDEADDWVARYGAVLRTGEPLHFEQEPGRNRPRAFYYHLPCGACRETPGSGAVQGRY